MKTIFKEIKRHKEQYPAIFNIDNYYCSQNIGYIVMDLPYDILRILSILCALIMLLAGAFLMCIWFLVICGIMTYIKRKSTIYQIIHFFQYENEVSNEKTVFDFILKKNKKKPNVKQVSDILNTLIRTNKIRKEGNMYYSNFSGPFKNSITTSKENKYETI